MGKNLKFVPDGQFHAEMGHSAEIKAVKTDIQKKYAEMLLDAYLKTE